MAVRLTKKTRQLLDIANEYKFITAHICARMIYKGKSQSLFQAQRKLKMLYDEGLLTRYEHPETKEYIYQITGKKMEIDDHRRYAMELYSRIYELAEEVIYFKIEETWQSCKRRSDAHIIFRIKDDTIGMLVEYDKFHKTSIKKLEDIYNSGEVQEWYSEHYSVEDYFPTYCVITLLGNTNYKSDNWDCVALDYSFSNLESILSDLG